MVFNWFGYSPGLSEMLSHSELIPDAALGGTKMQTEGKQRQTKANGSEKNKRK